MNFKIFPYGQLPNGKKIPLIDDWESKASCDPAQIKIWQDQLRSRIVGWGLPTGANGLFALDIDVKEGRNGFEYLKSQGIELPQTAHQWTPTGGCHLFFKDDPNLNLRNTANINTGVDTRAKGGFVWLYNPNFNLPIADIPSWVHTVVRKPINQIDPSQVNTYTLEPALAMERFNSALALVTNAQPGERNQTLNTASYLIGQLVTAGAVHYEFAFAELTKAAQSIGLDPYEIQATSLSGLKGGASHPLTHPFGDTPPVPVMQIQAPMPMAVAPSRWTPRFATVAELMDWSKLKRPQLFEDWSPQDLILTSAIGGVGKTTIKLYEAVCLALGEPFLGFKCLKPGRTLFIVGEDSEEKLKAMIGRICKQIGLFEPGQEHRLNAVLDGVLIKRENFPLVSFNKAINNYVPNDVTLGLIKQAVDDLQPKQIVFDPIGMFAGPESGGNDAAKAMMEAAHAILKMSDASVDIISHIGKDSATKKDVGQFSARGATAMANHSRVIRTLLKLNPDEFREVMGEPLTEGHTAIQCFTSKFSDGSPILDKPFMIIRDGYLFSRKEIPLTSPGQGTGVQDQQRVYEYIKAYSHEGKPMSESVVQDHFYLANPRIMKGNTKSYIGKLKFDGLIEERTHIDGLAGTWLKAT